MTDHGFIPEDPDRLSEPRNRTAIGIAIGVLFVVLVAVFLWILKFTFTYLGAQQ